MGHVPGARHFSVYGVNTYDTDDAPLASFTRMWAFQLSLRGLTAADTDRGLRRPHRRVGGARVLVPRVPRSRARRGARRRAAGLGARPVTPIERDAESPSSSASYEYATVRERVATWRDVVEAIDDRGPRDRGHASRPRVPRRPSAARVRCGTVPGAVHLEWLEHLDADGRMKPPDALRALFESRMASPPTARSWPSATPAIAPLTRTSRCACSTTRGCATTSARGRSGATARAAPVVKPED